MSINTLQSDSTLESYVLSLMSFPLEHLFEIRKWECADIGDWKLSHDLVPRDRLPDATGEQVSQLLKDFVHGQGRIDRHHPDGMIRDRLIDVFCDLKLLKRLQDGSRFQTYDLTDIGSQSMICALRLGNPIVALSTREDKSVSEYTVWEMLLLLWKRDWEHQVVQSGSTPPDPYKLGGPKLWFTKCSQNSICREYLLALLTVKDDGTVPHFGKSSQYQEMVGVEPKRKKPPDEFPMAKIDEDDWDAGAKMENMKKKKKRTTTKKKVATSLFGYS